MIAYGKMVATAAGFIFGGPVGGVLAYGAAIAAEKIMEPDEEEFIITDGMLAYLFACLGKVAVADGELCEDEKYNLKEILECNDFDEEAKDLAYHYFDYSGEMNNLKLGLYKHAPSTYQGCVIAGEIKAASRNVRHRRLFWRDSKKNWRFSTARH